MMRLAGLLALSPLVGAAQGLPDHPRAVDIFAPATGYADMAPDRVGTPAQPFPNELGLYLVSRMLRNTCLTLETGAPLDAALPPGFAVFESNVYLMGTEPTGEMAQVTLSATGDIDKDETEGHPTFRLSARADGMTCTLDWRMAEPPLPEGARNMAIYIEQWLPYEFALVRVERPTMAVEPALTGVAEWDRPCGTKWCPMSVIYELDRGAITLKTVLNITAIEGQTP